MILIPEIGHVAVTVSNRVYAFRPTLANISRVGSPVEVVELAATLLSTPQPTLHAWRQVQVKRAHWRAQLGAALGFLYSCADESIDGDELAELLGTLTPPRRYRPGKVPADILVLLGQQLARHGVIGVVSESDLPPAPRPDDYVAEFNAAEMAALAQAHLGASLPDAWGMTMTSLARGLAAKYPVPKDSAAKPMTVEDNDRALAWLEKVNEARANG